MKINVKHRADKTPPAQVRVTLTYSGVVDADVFSYYDHVLSDLANHDGTVVFSGKSTEDLVAFIESASADEGLPSYVSDTELFYSVSFVDLDVELLDSPGSSG